MDDDNIYFDGDHYLFEPEISALISAVRKHERERAAMIVENAYVYSPYIVRKLGIAERKAEIAAKIRGEKANG